VSQSEPEQQRTPRYAIADDGTLRRVEATDDPTAGAPVPAGSPAPANPYLRAAPGPPRPPIPRPPIPRPPIPRLPSGPSKALVYGVAIGGTVALLAGIGVAVTMMLGGTSTGTALTGVASATTPARPGTLAVPRTATPGAAAGHSTLTGPSDALPVDRAAFLRDFRTDFPGLAGGRSDENLLAEADALCVGLRYPLSWNVLVAQVRTRYGARNNGADVLSLIASHLCPPDY